MSGPFIFPAQPAGPPSRRNWYQELLDHPECRNDPVKIQEAYTNQRSQFYSNNIRLFEEACACDDLNHCRKIVPAIQTDAKLRQLLEDQARAQSTGGRDEHGFGAEMGDDVGCLVIWARPSPTILSLIQSIQQSLKALTGNDLYTVPTSDLHLSVLELSHRHDASHLQGVADRVGDPLLRRMLDEPARVYQTSGCCARLMRPQLSIDKAGIAIPFIPGFGSQAPSEPRTKLNDNTALGQPKSNEVDDSPETFTYHHLRNNLQKLALSSGIEIDTCYTAATAHVAIGRFIGTEHLLPSDGEDRSSEIPSLPETSAPHGEHGANENDARRVELRRLVDGINAINAKLQEQHEAGLLPDWKIGWESGLELQLGLVKYGRASDAALMVGRRGM